MSVAAAYYEIRMDGVVIKTGAVMGHDRFSFTPPDGNPHNYTIRFMGPPSSSGSYVGRMTFSALALKR